jgi:hypothetical protein
MIPAPIGMSPLERAQEYEVASRIANDRQDFVFAAELAQHAQHLRTLAQTPPKPPQMLPQ